MYDWAGIRYKCQNRRGQLLQDPPKWQLRGLEVYELFRDVFFLDRVERRTEAKDAADRAKIERFQDLLLRARDGELKEKDWHYIKENMDYEKVAESFKGPEVYKLVTRRRDRDEYNLNVCLPAFARALHAPSLTSASNLPHSWPAGARSIAEARRAWEKDRGDT